MSVQATTWAMGQAAGSPLNKLILMAVSDWADADGVWSLNVPKLAAFCEADESSIEAALSALTERSLAAIVGAAVQLAFHDRLTRPDRPSAAVPQWRIAKAKRFAIYARDGHACVYCGAADALSLDHVVPRSKGGSDSEHNLVTACQPCNSSKRDRDLSEWGGRQ